VETALHRCDGTDQFENRDFLEKVREKYLELAKKENFFVINANNGLNKVNDDIKRILSPNFGICL